MKSSGIYMIRCKPSGRAYIGQSIDIIRRWKHHQYKLIAQKHGNPILQASWNKYGPEAFEFSVLKLCPIDKLDYHECAFIDKYKTAAHQGGFNITDGGSTRTRSTPRSQETRDKIAKGHTKIHMVNGYETTVTEQAKIVNLPINTLYNRLYRGMTLEEAVKMPYQISQVRR